MLYVHRAERADALVVPLARVLAEPAEDPFVPEVVAVPTRGVERWLAQRLSHHLGADGEAVDAGVCANVSFAPPSRVADLVLSQVLALDPEHDPWRLERLSWAVLEVLDEAVAEAWCAPLARYLGAGSEHVDDLRSGRRLGLARRLAALFTAYGTQRPEMVWSWAAARDDDGAGRAVPADLAWQPPLWRRVRERIGFDSPVERLQRAVELVTADPGRVALPARVSVFGPTRLPEDQLRLLQALSGHRDVHLWLVHPSPALWAAVEAQMPNPSRRRGERPIVANHPLLASMARDIVELQGRLATPSDGFSRRHLHHRPPITTGGASLLGDLQQRLRADTTSGPAHDWRPDDRSIEVHACHGRARQVEVLRELLVGLFADDPTLEPSDVLVMCPDVESVAPLVAASFGSAPDVDAPDNIHPGQRLRVRLADRSLRQTNPQLALLSTLLDLADGRVTASEVLDLAATAPVRRRFRFTDDDLDRIRQWAVATGARWGEDLGRRARFGLPQLRQGTWDAALDRLLLGVAMAEEDHRFVGPALPLDDVDSTDIDLAGRLAELLDRLGAVLADLTGARPAAAWIDALDTALDLLADAAPAQAWQGVQARQLLADVRAAMRDHGPALRLPDVRAMLADRLKGRPTRAGFRTGALTVCSLEPMRAVPHRVVCLLGLDDGVFPRTGTADGDDVLLRDPWIGERDRRSEDRQLFLDAVLAAGERLVVLYSGADERTGAVRPPAVPVGELLDALDRSTVTEDGRSVREHLVIHHPLQPVDPRNFTSGVLRRPGPFSFDAVAHRAALAGSAVRLGATPFLTRPLPREPRADTVHLDDLVAMLEHPVRWFLRRRLGILLVDESESGEDVDDGLPLELDGLATWAIGDRLLSACLAQVPRDRAIAAEWRRGEVPPRRLGRATLEAVAAKVTPVAAAVRGLLTTEPEVVDVTADLPCGIAVTGSVPGTRGDLVVRAVYARLAAKHRLRAWVQVLALTTADPDRRWGAVTAGRGGGTRNSAVVATIRPPDAAVAGQRLEDLVRLRERALREPLPMPPATACAYARARLAGDSEEQALDDAGRTWAASFEVRDRHHALCWGDDADLRIVAGTPAPDELSWAPEGTRLGVLARRVWEPLLAHEEMHTA